MTEVMYFIYLTSYYIIRALFSNDSLKKLLLIQKQIL